jgi:hypothetical protein
VPQHAGRIGQACLDPSVCHRLTQILADLRLAPGEWVFREGEPASFYVLLEGSLRIVLDGFVVRPGFSAAPLPTTRDFSIGS